jgi:hypothetical protein
MGMESYFVRLHANAPIHVEEFHNALFKCNIGFKKYKDRYIIDNAFILRINDMNGVLIEASIEGCFSWYEESLDKLFGIIHSIAEMVAALEARTPDNIYIPLKREVFKTVLKGFYHEKYSYFISEYGRLNIKLLPDKAFYDHVRSKKKTITRVFNRIFRREKI